MCVWVCVCFAEAQSLSGFDTFSLVEALEASKRFGLIERSSPNPNPSLVSRVRSDSAALGLDLSWNKTPSMAMCWLMKLFGATHLARNFQGDFGGHQNSGGP